MPLRSVEEELPNGQHTRASVAESYQGYLAQLDPCLMSPWFPQADTDTAITEID